MLFIDHHEHTVLAVRLLACHHYSLFRGVVAAIPGKALRQTWKVDPLHQARLTDHVHGR